MAAHGEPLSATGDRADELEAVAESGRRISGTELRELADGVRQVIWGEFRGYWNPSAHAPWVTVLAVNSTFYEVVSDDAVVLAEVSAALQDAEEVVNRILRDDGLVRVSICRRSDGLSYYREDRFLVLDDAPSAWDDGHPPSGLYASAHEAEADTRASIGWLRRA